jgi:drug/metabolite transporter (DMT)-like permease
MQQTGKRNLYIGVLLAVIATIIWSGNFIIARGISSQMPPFSINFYRWMLGTLFIFPFAIKTFLAEKERVLKHWKYFVFVALTCIVFFNSFVYIAGHYTSAINMALIGTTTSPVFTIMLSAIFLRESVPRLRMAGLAICIFGILVLLSNGSLDHLLAFRFSPGDWWILLGAFFFAVYNVLVKQKPAGISPLNFLFVFFLLGTIMLVPFYAFESIHSHAVVWNARLIGILLFLGLGTSAISYLCWNAAIVRIGSSRTALFGNLIPIFSTLEAVLILHEQVHLIHLVSGTLVITGLVLANSGKANQVSQVAA